MNPQKNSLGKVRSYHNEIPSVFPILFFTVSSLNRVILARNIERERAGAVFATP